MIDDLPSWIEVLFIVTCLLTIVFFYISNGKPKKVTLLIILWSVIQSILAYFGYYQTIETIPPRFILVLLPIIFLITYGLLPKQIDWIIQKRNLKISTFLHIVRVPVEIVLLYLFFNKMVPQLMTFEGRNFDILAGITSPVVGVLYLKNKVHEKSLIIWNIIGLFLVLFVLVNGLLSSEVSFQQFGFEQPNRAINYFPFVLLPATIVPIVIYTHLTDIIKLKNK